MYVRQLNGALGRVPVGFYPKGVLIQYNSTYVCMYGWMYYTMFVVCVNVLSLFGITTSHSLNHNNKQ